MRVLAIDGGGVRGVVPAAVLGTWENELGFQTPELFGAFAGTSTGSILAASLAIGLPAREVQATFQQKVETIFSREGLSFTEKALSFKGWAVPAYDNDALIETLAQVFGTMTLGECPRPLSIAALDVVTGSPRVFRSAHHEMGKSDSHIPIADAVLASTAAPTFFPSAAVAGSTYIDGAMWANNPAMIAWLDAKDLGVEHPKLLSLGCGTLFWGRDVGFGARRGLLGWGAPLASLMMTAQSEGVHDYLSRLCSRDDYLRVDPALPKELATLDNVQRLPALLVRAGEAARQARAEFSEWMGDL